MSTTMATDKAIPQGITEEVGSVLLASETQLYWRSYDPVQEVPRVVPHEPVHVVCASVSAKDTKSEWLDSTCT